MVFYIKNHTLKKKKKKNGFVESIRKMNYVIKADHAHLRAHVPSYFFCTLLRLVLVLTICAFIFIVLSRNVSSL